MYVVCDFERSMRGKCDDIGTARKLNGKGEEIRFCRASDEKIHSHRIAENNIGVTTLEYSRVAHIH